MRLAITSVAVLILASPGAAGEVNRELLIRQNQVMLKLQKAAVDRVIAATELAAEQLRQFCQDSGHFPCDLQESEQVRSEIAALMPANPFLFPSLSSQESTDEPIRDQDRTRVEIRTDRHLNEEAVRRYREFPPDDWTAPAGTVVVVTDGNRLAAIWASGADLRPIRDPLTTKLRMIIGRCGR